MSTFTLVHLSISTHDSKLSLSGVGVPSSNLYLLAGFTPGPLTTVQGAGGASASRGAQGVSGPLLSCMWNLRGFPDPPGSSVHGILQAKILEWPFLRQDEA